MNAFAIGTVHTIVWLKILDSYKHHYACNIEEAFLQNLLVILKHRPQNRKKILK